MKVYVRRRRVERAEYRRAARVVERENRLVALARQAAILGDEHVQRRIAHSEALRRAKHRMHRRQVRRHLQHAQVRRPERLVIRAALVEHQHGDEIARVARPVQLPMLWLKEKRAARTPNQRLARVQQHGARSDTNEQLAGRDVARGTDAAQLVRQPGVRKRRQKELLRHKHIVVGRPRQ